MIKLIEFTKEELYKELEEGKTDIDLMIEYIVNSTKAYNLLVDRYNKLGSALNVLEKENKKYKNLGFEHLCKRNEQLENKYNKALELLVEFSMPCERDDFNLVDTDWCELNCSNDGETFPKCWNRWIEWRLENE